MRKPLKIEKKLTQQSVYDFLGGLYRRSIYPRFTYLPRVGTNLLFSMCNVVHPLSDGKKLFFIDRKCKQVLTCVIVDNLSLPTGGGQRSCEVNATRLNAESFASLQTRIL